MEDTFDSAAVKARVLERAGREARWYRYQLPILIGTLGGFALFALYLTIVTVAQGWQHAVELFQQDAWLVIPIMVGFGVEVGLYTYLRGVLRQGSRRSKMMMGAGAVLRRQRWWRAACTTRPICCRCWASRRQLHF